MCQTNSTSKQQKSNCKLTISSATSSIPDLSVTDFDSLTFTPSTMAKIESVFSEFNAQLASENLNPESALEMWTDGGYIGDIEVAWDHSTDGFESDAPGAKTARMEHSYNQSPSATSQPALSQKPARKLPGPRPRRPIEEMTPIEAERRRRRRERNKNAATKCRQRRVDVTNELLDETTRLEKEMSKLEQEIENLRKQKSQLEYVLQSHMPICQTNSSNIQSHMPVCQTSPSNIRVEQQETQKPIFISQVNTATRPSTLQVTSVSTMARANTNPLSVITSVPSSSSLADSALMDFTPSTDLLSPSAYFVLSPSALLAQ